MLKAIETTNVKQHFQPISLFNIDVQLCNRGSATPEQMCDFFSSLFLASFKYPRFLCLLVISIFLVLCLSYTCFSSRYSESHKVAMAYLLVCWDCDNSVSVVHKKGKGIVFSYWKQSSVSLAKIWAM